MLVRAPDATHVYTGMDLARLTGASKPSVVVTAADLAKIGTRVPEFYAGDLFCPIGKTPIYMGQPVALLIFETVRRLRPGAACAARRDFREVRRGDRPGRDAQLRRLPLHPRGRRDARCARCLFADAGRLGHSRAFPEHRAAGLVAAARRKPGPPTARPRPMASRSAPSSPRTIRRCWCSTANSKPNRSTRCFWSRKAGSPGTTRSAKKLELVLGVQSPYEAAESIAFMLGKARAPFKPAHINGQFAYRRRRLRRTRPYAVPALRRAGGDVLSRPSGAAGA